MEKRENGETMEGYGKLEKGGREDRATEARKQVVSRRRKAGEWEPKR